MEATTVEHDVHGYNSTPYIECYSSRCDNAALPRYCFVDDLSGLTYHPTGDDERLQCSKEYAGLLRRRVEKIYDTT